MIYVLFVLFFFFKQKTAYEMRTSDWSSDVCSSDLYLCQRPAPPRTDRAARADGGSCRRDPRRGPQAPVQGAWVLEHDAFSDRARTFPPSRTRDRQFRGRRERNRRPGHRPRMSLHIACDKTSSEEHTSELQSLMSISYAVF